MGASGQSSPSARLSLVPALPFPLSLSSSLCLFFSVSLSPSFLITRSSPFGICGGGRRIQACKAQSPSDGKSDHSSSFSGGLWSVLQDRCLDPELVPGSSLNLDSGLHTCPLFLSSTPVLCSRCPHLYSYLVKFITDQVGKKNNKSVNPNTKRHFWKSDVTILHYSKLEF